MADKSRLFAIKELSFTEMDDAQLDACMMELFFFCDTLPSHKATLEATLEEKDYDAFLSFLESLRGFLLNIHAEGLADACKQLRDELGAVIENGLPVVHEKVKADLRSFFTALDTLSIDILVAGLITDYTQPEPPDKQPDISAPTHEVIVGEGGDEAEEAPRQDISILAVDDAEFFLRMLKIHFKDTPYELNCVTSGELAVRFLAEPGKQAPDLFLLDTDMPKMSGYDLARIIRHAGLKAPIIFLTSVASRDVVTEALMAGGSDLIVKASSKEQILERVGRRL